MKKLILILLVACLGNTGTAQDDLLFSKDFRGVELGLNMSPLLSKFIPFQNATLISGPYNIVYRGGKNNRFFQMKFGANVPSLDAFIQPSDIHFNISLGFLRRRILSKRFSYSFGHNFMAYGGSLNTPADSGADSAGLGYGFESNISFHLNKFIALETGLLLFAGIDLGYPRITFVPPLALNVVIRLEKS